MSRRDRLTPSLWIGGVDAATAELPRGQGAFTFGPAEPLPAVAPVVRAEPVPVPAAAPAFLYWHRCRDCLSVVTVAERLTVPATCGACGGKCESLGRTNEDGTRARHVEERCPCDERCTGARGPKCACQCGGKNHGTHARVTVTVVEGLPVLGKPRDAAKLLANVGAYRAARDGCNAAIEDKFGWVFRRKASGAWVDGAEFRFYRAGCEFLSEVREVAGLRTHGARMARFERLAARIAAEPRP